jgi:hypothetical protein
MILQGIGHRRGRDAGQVVAWALAFTMALTGVTRAGETSREAKQEAKSRFVSGQSHYNLNEFPEALVDFKEAYRLFPDPVFLYNLGQCERQLGHNEEAIRFYRSFLREQPKAPNRQDVLHKIEELEAAQKSKPPEAEEAAGATDAAAPPAVEGAAATMPVPAPAAPPHPVIPPPAAAPSIRTEQSASPEAAPATAPDLPSPETAAPLPTAAPVVEDSVGGASRIDLSTQATAEPSASPPIYKRWWFWAATGVAVAGASIAIYAASASQGASAPDSTLGTKKVF